LAGQRWLTLHFNAARTPGAGLQQQEEPLINVAAVF